MCNMPGPAVTRARLCECCVTGAVSLSCGPWSQAPSHPRRHCGFVVSSVKCLVHYIGSSLSGHLWGSPRLGLASPGYPCPQREAQLVGAGSPGLLGKKAGTRVSQSWPGISWPCQPGGAGLLGLIEPCGLAELGCITRQAQRQSAGGTCGLWVLRTHWLSPLLLCTLRPQVQGPMGSCSPPLSFWQEPWGCGFLGVQPGVTVVEHGEAGDPSRVLWALPSSHGASHSCGQPSPELLQPIHSPEGTGVRLPSAWGSSESGPMGRVLWIRAGVGSGLSWREGPSGAGRKVHRGPSSECGYKIIYLHRQFRREGWALGGTVPHPHQRAGSAPQPPEGASPAWGRSVGEMSKTRMGGPVGDSQCAQGGANGVRSWACFSIHMMGVWGGGVSSAHRSL